jgi:DNA mismatch endonuclease (patch repair protein)
MSDVFSRSKRSQVMSAIRGKGNRSTELRLIEILKEHKIAGWRRNFPLIGKPDFVFPKRRLVVFVDGCFWHACPRCGSFPKQNSRFWRQKLTRNTERDAEVTRSLRDMHWRVVRIWEHELRDSRKIIKKLELLTVGEEDAGAKRRRTA